jgi:hypothetical protein
MRIVSYLFFAAIGMLVIVCSSCSKDNNGEEKEVIPEMTVKIPAGGNTWVVDNPFKGEQLITDEGVKGWSDKADKLRIFFKVPQAGLLHVGIKARVDAGVSELNCTVAGKTKKVTITGNQTVNHFVGSFEVLESGYHFAELEGLSKDGSTFAEISGLALGGEATSGKMFFVNEDFYWGRRGPSVHLS